MRTAWRQPVRTPSWIRKGSKDMIRTLNAEKVKLLKANKREVVSTILFLVLLFAAVLFIAFAGHI
jgi:hypothetical protein